MPVPIIQPINGMNQHKRFDNEKAFSNLRVAQSVSIHCQETVSTTQSLQYPLKAQLDRRQSVRFNQTSRYLQHIRSRPSLPVISMVADEGLKAGRSRPSLRHLMNNHQQTSRNALSQSTGGFATIRSPGENGDNEGERHLSFREAVAAKMLNRTMTKGNFKLPDLMSVTQAAEVAARTKKNKRPRRPDLGRKFKAAAWISIIIRRLCAANTRNSEDSDSPYMRNIKFVDNFVNDGKGNLLFDAKAFKANRELRMSEDAKRILNNPSWARTDQDLLHVEISLRSVQDYADYPVAIQRKIAEVGEFRKYEARRIIVREGHCADNFYFMLSGSVVVLVMDDDRKFVKPKAVLRRGQSFGELAIINGDRRRSTVVATEEVEMLALWHEDYQAIFMDGGSKRSEDEFIRSLPFLSHWPLEIVDDQPQLFRYHFYKRGEIVVRDTNVSKWIIVVKSGSLNVMKKLRKVEAFEWKKRQLTDKKGASRTSPKIPIDMKDLLDSRDHPHWNSTPPPVSPQNEPVAHVEQTPPKKPPAKRMESRVSKSLDLAMSGIEGVDRSSFEEEIITASTDLDVGYTNAEQGESEADLHPMFVHIQTLIKADVFGLNDIVIGKQPSFCMVSNGAECIMIDKEFFKENLTEQGMKKIRSEAQAYPSDDELQSNLQVAVDWDAYRASTLKSAVTHNQHKRNAENSYLRRVL